MKYFLVLIILVRAYSVNAQQASLRWGYLRDSVTHEVIPLASVTNINTKTTVMTSASGRFRIALKENQVLSFAAVGYHFDTIHYTAKFLSEDTLSLFLSPLSHSLGNVTVTSSKINRYQLDSMQRRKDFFRDIADYTIPTVAKANSGAGIALNIDHFSRHERNKRKAMAFFESNEKEAYINYRFPPELVAKYSGLKGEKLQNFMQQYRPSSEWLRQYTEEADIMYYINDKLKSFTGK
jgi:hypothetical protein